MADAGQTPRSQRRLREVDEAARRVIIRKGLKAATMRDICARAGSPPAS